MLHLHPHPIFEIVNLYQRHRHRHRHRPTFDHAPIYLTFDHAPISPSPSPSPHPHPRPHPHPHSLFRFNFGSGLFRVISPRKTILRLLRSKHHRNAKSTQSPIVSIGIIEYLRFNHIENLRIKQIFRFVVLADDRVVQQFRKLSRNLLA